MFSLMRWLFSDHFGRPSLFFFCFQFKKHRLSVVHTNTYAKSVVNMADVVSINPVHYCPRESYFLIANRMDNMILIVSLLYVTLQPRCLVSPRWPCNRLYWLWCLAGKRNWSKLSIDMPEIPSCVFHTVKTEVVSYP